MISLVVIQVDDSPLVRADVGVPDGDAGGARQLADRAGDDILATIDGTEGRDGVSDSWAWESWELAPNTDLPLWVASLSDAGRAG